MKEFEQVFITTTRPLCSRFKTRFGEEIQERKFVTLAGDPDRMVCGNCGYTRRKGE